MVVSEYRNCCMRDLWWTPDTPQYAQRGFTCIQVSVSGCGVGGSSSMSSASDPLPLGTRTSLGGSGWISLGTCACHSGIITNGTCNVVQGSMHDEVSDRGMRSHSMHMLRR